MRIRQIVALIASTLMAAPTVAERTFSPEDILNWEHQQFVGETGFSLAQRQGKTAIHIQCNDSTASGWFLEESIDLTETPVLEWSWRMEKGFSNLDETARDGDDQILRVYAVDQHSILRWRTRALNYVWSSEEPEGSDWANPHQPVARNIALRSGPAGDDTDWYTERRNLREDFRKYHERDVDSVDTLAIIANCDNTDQSAEGWFGELRLRRE